MWKIFEEQKNEEIQIAEKMKNKLQKKHCRQKLKEQNRRKI